MLDGDRKGNRAEGTVADETFARRAWPEAYAALQEASLTSELRAPDLERFGVVAQMLGRDEECARLWERAHQAFIGADDVPSAARCAFWLALGFMERGEMAQAGGWLARAQRVLQESAIDCPEQGYIRIPQALQLLEEGDAARARTIFEELQSLARRFGDRDLLVLGCLGSGQALIRMGDPSRGASLLDEAMVAVTANEISPNVAGIVYCAVIEACHEMFDFRRAGEWTDALTRWCAEQPGLVPFRGRCQVYRAELMQLRGDWPGAFDAVLDAERRLSGPPAHPAVGTAFYQKGELHRLRGALADADDAFRRAEEWGRRPEPGRSLLRLAQGRTDAAANAIRHALDESVSDVARAPLLAAAVEILIAAGDEQAAVGAADGLERIATTFNSSSLQAASFQARGRLALHSSDGSKAFQLLRAAVAGWQSLAAPFEAARTRVLLAKAANLLGESETAEEQLGLARRAFEELGGVVHFQAFAPGDSADARFGLTARELEVLRLVSRGLTNKAISASLTISEKTAANHVANILGKLGLSSRAAATAFAYEHHLV